MDELPELPFEQILSYLKLEDRLKARGISRRWYHKINSFKVNTLCYSDRPIGFIFGKRQLVSGAFAENFISSTRFASFFDTFCKSILANLKHLRLCELHLNEEDSMALARILNSFGQLEELDIIWSKLIQKDVLKLNLNLPMLTRIRLEYISGIEKVTLETPRLKSIIFRDYLTQGVTVDIVHGESVERLITNRFGYVRVEKLKNLQYLYVAYLPWIRSPGLSSLQRLKEIYTNCSADVPELFEEKQRSGHVDLKIYLCGLLLNGADDPARNALRHFSSGHLSKKLLICLAENRSRLANQIHFDSYLNYSAIESVALGLEVEVDLLKRLTHLNELKVDHSVQDIQRFLYILKNCEKISELSFSCDQPQDLFDRLPEHCAVQSLFINRPPADLAFLFRLKHLIDLEVHWPIDSQTIRRAFDELPVLSSFVFRFDFMKATIQRDHPKQFQVSVGYMKKRTVCNLNVAIEFIVENQ